MSAEAAPSAVKGSLLPERRGAWRAAAAMALLVGGFTALQEVAKLGERTWLLRAEPAHAREQAWPLGAPAPHTDRPIIGVLTVPVDAADYCVSRRRRLFEGVQSDALASEANANETSCFSSTYAQWLVAAGARVVPLRYDLPPHELDALLRQCNGLFLTGGDVELRRHPNAYMRAAKHVLAHVVESNLNGTYVPLWGTCMGLQTLGVLVGGEDVLEYHVFQGVYGRMMSLELSDEADGSRLFGSGGSGGSGLLSPRLREWFQSKNVTVNYHHDGLAPSSFESNGKLASFFRVLSTNTDANGKPFVSTIEARDFPIYAVQYHPERPQFEFLNKAKDPVSHELEAVACNAFLAQAFVQEARNNDRAFASKEAEKAALLDNWAPRGGFSHQTYFFDKPEAS